MNPPLTAAALLAGKSRAIYRVADLPVTLANIALDLAFLFDKLSPNDNPTLERGHELITWNEHPELCLEVSGDDGAMLFHGIWAGGVNITDFAKDQLWTDALMCIEAYNDAHNVEQQTAAVQNRDDIKKDK